MASHRLNRALRGTLTTGMAFALVIGTSQTPASGDPEAPANASEAMKQLQQVSGEAEKLTEQLHAATDELEAKKGELDQAKGAVEEAGRAREAARVEEEKYRGRVDQLTGSSFQGTGPNQLSALLASKSANQYLETMSRLDMVATDQKRAVDGLTQATRQAAEAERSAAENQAKAEQAITEADRIKIEIEERKKAMDAKVEDAKKALARLSPAESKKLKSVDKEIVNVPGSGIAVAALNRAQTRIGSPYVWAATGPNTFDCSGLVVWAYKEVGRSLPRSSRQQAVTGAPVSRGSMRAGDLVFLGSPVHHVGIAVDSNRYLHAPQSGDVVRIANIPWAQVSGIRRIS